MDIVDFNVNEAQHVGDEDNGCYYQVAEVPTSGWYVTVVVDSAGFVDTLSKDHGPHQTERETLDYGHNEATDWCMVNGVA